MPRRVIALDDDGEGSDEGGERDEERDQCMDVDVASLVLVECEEDGEVNDDGPEVGHHLDVGRPEGEDPTVLEQP